MTKDEALRKAIEQIKWADHLHDWHDGLLDALQACKDALAETQEPVATVSICVETNLIQVHWLNVPKDKALLYTTPPSREWVGLSDRELFNLSQQCDLNHILGLIDYGRAIEAKLREINNA